MGRVWLGAATLAHGKRAVLLVRTQLVLEKTSTHERVSSLSDRSCVSRVPVAVSLYAKKRYPRIPYQATAVSV